MSESDNFEMENLAAICGDQQVGKVLGMHSDWVEYLERKGHLKSLGGRTPGCQRYYASTYILSLRTNEAWLDKAVRLVRLHFRGKNSKRDEKGGKA